METDRKADILLLVQKSKKGDLDAFGELIRLYQEKAYGLAFSFLHNPTDAEDISQEAFLQAFKKLQSFDGSGSFGAWLLTIVANRSKNKIRWKKIRERLTFSLDEPSGDPDREDQPRFQPADTDRRSDPSAHADASWQTQKLSRSMDRLSPRQRTAIELKFIQGYKISEVAGLMGLSEGTVKTHIFRGLESLKNRIGKEE